MVVRIQVQVAINAASTGDTVTVYSGTYYENINVTKQLILTGIDSGKGKPVVDARGNAITLSAGGSTLEGFWVRNGGQGIYVISDNNVIKNNTVSNNGASGFGYGISLFSSSNNVLSRNNVSNNNVVGIYLFSSSNNTLSGNIANSNRGEFGAAGISAAGISLTSSNNNMLIGNIVSNNYNGIYLIDSSHNTLSGNIANSNINDLGAAGIILLSSSNNMLSGNTAFNNGNGIELDHSSNNILSGNTAWYNTRWSGIELYDSSNNRLNGNNFSNNVEGIDLSSSGNNMLSGNTASNNGGMGISLESSDFNTIGGSGNTASNNSLDGIYLLHSSLNTLSRDTASNNGVYGIYLESSNFNTISGNTALNNYYGGIYLPNSSLNIIYNNTFNKINNAGIAPHALFSYSIAIIGLIIIAAIVVVVFTKRKALSEVDKEKYTHRLDFLRKTKGFLFKPSKTFDATREEPLREAIKYYAVISAISAVLSLFIGTLFGSMTRGTNLGMLTEAAAGNAITYFVLFMIRAIIEAFIVGSILHIFVAIVGGKKGIAQTIKAMMYGSTPGLLLGWIPIIGAIASIWSQILNILGIRQLHELSTGRAILAVLLMIFIIGIIYGFALILFQPRPNPLPISEYCNILSRNSSAYRFLCVKT
jgi:parallel beta-helix repeat protein